MLIFILINLEFLRIQDFGDLIISKLLNFAEAQFKMDEEQVAKIKEQIISQIDSWHASDEQKEQAKEQISAMSNEELEQFLIKNNEQNGKQGVKQECPFCLILEGKIPSYKIDENKASIAILEINPLSRGHVLIVPRKHGKKTGLKTIVKKVSKKIKDRLNPKNINISAGNVLGHDIINIVPDYGLPQERKKAEKDELEGIAKELKIEVKKEKAIRETSSKKIEQAPRRIP